MNWINTCISFGLLALIGVNMTLFNIELRRIKQQLVQLEHDILFNRSLVLHAPISTEMKGL